MKSVEDTSCDSENPPPCLWLGKLGGDKGRLGGVNR